MRASRTILLLLLLLGLGLPGCGPEETESMRQQRSAREREAAETRQLLKQAQQDVREYRRQLGLSTR